MNEMSRHWFRDEGKLSISHRYFQVQAGLACYRIASLQIQWRACPPMTALGLLVLSRASNLLGRAGSFLHSLACHHTVAPPQLHLKD
uniref:Uncharacterized protein n=1 Tax=Arundo donax TaxID=35708 RepID=A0A0A9DMF2_ARUDO